MSLFNYLIAVVTITALPYAARAQNEPDRVPPPMLAREGFDALTKQGTTLVAEPVPNHLAVDFGSAIHTLKRNDVTLCTVNARRQFTFPAVSAEEVAQWVKQAHQTLKTHSFPKPPSAGSDVVSYHIVNLVRHLEKNGQERVPLSSASQEVKALADYLLFDNFAGQLAASVARADGFLSKLEKAYLTREDRGSLPGMLQVGLAGADDQRWAFQADANQPVGASVVKLSEDMTQQETTLKALVDSLGKKTGTSLVLAPELSDKFIIVRDGGKTSPENILRAIAELYKLRVQRNDTSMRLSLREPKPVENTADLRQSVLQSIPAPLCSWAFREPADIETGAPLESNVRLPEWRNTLYGYLSAVYDKKTEGKTGKRLPVSSLSARERSAVAVALACQCLEQLGTSFKTTPRWLEKYDNLTVSVSRSQGEDGEYGSVTFYDGNEKPLVSFSTSFRQVP